MIPGESSRIPHSVRIVKDPVEGWMRISPSMLWNTL
jgi:hypothetical protein